MIDFSRHQREYLDTVKDDVISDLSSRGMNATGALRRSLRVVENQYLRAQLRAQDYLAYVVTKNTSKKPKKPGFWPDIVTWMKAKGIRPKRDGVVVPGTGTNYKRSAFAIAKGIIAGGTKYQKPRSRPGVDLNAHLKDNLPPYLEGIARELLLNFKDKIE